MEESYSENRHAENKSIGPCTTSTNTTYGNREPLEEKTNQRLSYILAVFDDHSHHNSHTNGVDPANQCRAAPFRSVVCKAGMAGLFVLFPRCPPISASPGREGEIESLFKLVVKLRVCSHVCSPEPILRSCFWCTLYDTASTLVPQCQTQRWTYSR